MKYLMIKDDVNLKILEDIGFEYCIERLKNPEAVWNGEENDFYTEESYEYNTGINTIIIIVKRDNYKWNSFRKVREVCVELNDYDAGVSSEALVKIYELSKLGILEEKEDTDIENEMT